MADIQFKEIKNGVAIITPNGHEYIYTVYPWRMDKIDINDLGKVSVREGSYDDITFNKGCGIVRLTKENQKLLTTAKLLANINKNIEENNRYLGNNELLTNKIKMFIELAYKNQVKEFGRDTDLSYDDYRRLSLLKNIPNKIISQIVMENQGRNLTDILKQLMFTTLEEGISNTIIKQIKDMNDYFPNLIADDFTTLRKYNKQITHMIETQDKKLQAVQNDIDAIVRSIPIHLTNWLPKDAIQKAFKIRAECDNPSNKIRIPVIVQKIGEIEFICNEMELPLMDYIKDKSYSEFIIGYNRLKKEFEDFKEKHKFEMFDKRQHKLPEYNKIIDNHKIDLVIPYTYKDCQKIGKDFCNCFGEYEWRNYLLPGTCYGCALYKDNEPYICIDISVKTNRIGQALYPCNSSINKSDTIAKTVLNELQNLFNNIK